MSAIIFVFLLITFAGAAPAVAATYQAMVQGALQLPDPITNVLSRNGEEGTTILDFFEPVVLEGNAGFEPFAGVESFESGVLRVELGGPSGFARPRGVSFAEGSAVTREVLLTNLTNTALPVTLRFDYSFSLSTTAADGESALASLELDVLKREQGEGSLSIFKLSKVVLFTDAQQETSFVDLSVVLNPGSATGFSLSAETRGDAASSVPEPGTAWTCCAAALFVLARLKARRYGNQR